MKTKKITMAILFVLVLCGLSLAEWAEPVPVTEVNTEYADWTPFLSFDGLSLYFARGRITGYYDYFRIYEATRKKPYGPFTSVNEVFSTSGKHVFSPWVSADNLRMYYFEQTVDPILWKIKVSERASVNDPWPQGTEISELNALGRVIDARLTEDELIIFFRSPDIPGEGGYDIWMASRPDRNSPFGPVTNLAEINTAANEVCPSISPDGLTLVFQSDINGPWQFFMTTRQSLNDPFSNIEQIPIPEVPDYTNHHPCLSSDGDILYFIRLFGDDKSTGDIYVSYWLEDYLEIAITNIEEALAEKLDALDKVNAALEKEWAACEALQDLLEIGDYGDLNEQDITMAIKQVESSIMRQELSIQALQRSIEKLEYALAYLGWEMPPEPQPVSYWKFDEGEGTIAYDSAGTNDGTIYGATWTTGQVDGALSFDGSNDYVSVPHEQELNITGDISIAAWVYLTQGSLYQAIVTKCVGGGAQDNPYDFRTNNHAEPLLTFVRADASGHERVYSSERIYIGQWHHVLVRVEDKVPDFYIDGVITGKWGDTIFTKTPTGNSNPVLIGRRDDGLYFNGAIDDVRIYDIALSAEDIQQLYQNGLAEF